MEISNNDGSHKHHHKFKKIKLGKMVHAFITYNVETQ